MNISVKWYFDFISVVGNDVTLVISFECLKTKCLAHIMAGKIWDIDNVIEKLRRYYDETDD